MIQYCFVEVAVLKSAMNVRTACSELFSFSFVDYTQWHFYVSDEEYPELPPLPLSSPPCSSSLDNHPSSKRNITSQPSGEKRQNLPATEKSYYQTKYTAYVGNDNTGWASTESESPYSQGFFASQVPKNHHLPGCYTQDEILKVTQPLVQDMSDDIQIDPDPVFTCTSVTSSRSPTFGSSFQDLILNTTNSINNSECSAVDGATPVNENVTVVQGLEKTVDRMVQEICQGKCRFDYVYHPNRQTKGLYSILTNAWVKLHNIALDVLCSVYNIIYINWMPIVYSGW